MVELTDEVLMMTPPVPCSIMILAASRLIRNTPATLVAISAAQVSSSVSMTEASWQMPALLTNTSTEPRRSTAVASVRSTSLRSETLPEAVTTSRPSPARRDRARSRASADRGGDHHAVPGGREPAGHLETDAGAPARDDHSSGHFNAPSVRPLSRARRPITNRITSGTIVIVTPAIRSGT